MPKQKKILFPSLSIAVTIILFIAFIYSVFFSPFILERWKEEGYTPAGIEQLLSNLAVFFAAFGPILMPLLFFGFVGSIIWLAFALQNKDNESKRYDATSSRIENLRDYKMDAKNRPTCVTVIGWVWIILGTLMCFFGLIGFAFVQLDRLPGAGILMRTEHLLFVRIFPFLVILQLVIAILAIVSGINFLMLKSWARSFLEAVSWLFILFTIFLYVVIVIQCFMEPSNFDYMCPIIAFFALAFYAVPMGIVLKFLRSKRVKETMQ
jgi:hypothetical protein